MTKMILHIFYCCLTFSLYANGKLYFTLSPEKAEFVMFAAPFAFLLKYKLSYPILFFLGLGSSLACTIKPNLWLRAVSSSLFAVLLSVKFSYGMVTHAEHAWLVTSAIVCFFAIAEPLTSLRNLIVLRLTQSTVLGFYFMSGLWKLRNLGFSGWGEATLEHHASALAQGSKAWPYFYEMVVVNFPWLPWLGFAVIIIFQLSAVIPMWTGKYFMYWGIAGVLFHVSTGVVLGIWFVPMALANIVLLVLFDKILDWERDQNCVASHTSQSTN